MERHERKASRQSRDSTPSAYEPPVGAAAVMNAHARTYKTRAIVLRARNLGEADKIYTLLTEARGKVNAVAKGVRRAKSQVAGRLEFAAEAFLTMHRGRNLDVITSAQLVTPRWTVTTPASFATAHLLVELVDAFCETELAMPEIYALLLGALGALDAYDEPSAIVPRFELRLLAELGFAPECECCVGCGRELATQAAWADLAAGGLACERCRAHGADAWPLARDDVHNFQALAALAGSGRKPAMHATPAARRAVDAFVTYHLGKRPKSGKVLEEIGR